MTMSSLVAHVQPKQELPRETKNKYWNIEIVKIMQLSVGLEKNFWEKGSNKSFNLYLKIIVEKKLLRKKGNRLQVLKMGMTVRKITVPFTKPEFNS